jgi:CRP-like cAMP-binding protein
VNHQADIYSLGVVMFGLLTGHRPFVSKDLHDLLNQITENEAPALRQYRPDIPDLLEPIVKKALAKDIKDRYQNASDMGANLNAIHKKLVHAVVITDVGMREKLERLKKLRFFKDFFEIELSEVINASEWLEYSAGQVIISEEDLDDSFYVVVTGEVSVMVEGKFITELRAGDCFGEMAYISKRPRTAGIEASSDVTALKVNNAMLESVSVYCQLKFTKVFLNTLLARLSGINRKLVGKDGKGE